MATKTLPGRYLGGLTRSSPLIILSCRPLAFSERLREALVKHTALAPETVEGKLILKDKFVTRSTFDIQKKLQKLAVGPEGTPDRLLKVATSVFYNRDQEEAQDQERKIKKKRY